MKNKIVFSILLSFISIGNAKAQLAVFDGIAEASLERIEGTAKNIQNDTANIKDTNQKILDGITKDKKTNMESTQKTMEKAPSPAAATKGAAKSLTQLNKQTINAAKGIMYGLRAGDQVIALAAPKDSEVARVNELYAGSVDLLESLILIAEAINNDIEFREQNMQTAAAQVGKSADVKASMDQNTFMQIENTRAINQLISAQNYSLSASNAETRNNLTRQAETGRMLAYRNVNPFK